MIKKLLLLALFCSLFMGTNNAQAATVYDNGCRGTVYSTITGNKCGTVLGESIDTTTTETKTNTFDTKTFNTNDGIVNNVKKSITVLSPNGGEFYQNGQQITVRWTSKNIPADTLLEVNIYSTNPQFFGFLAPNGTPNDGSETFTLNSLPNGSNYIIVVGVPFAGLNNSALSVKDESDMPFTISDSIPTCISGSRQSITVISPNGGESYTPSQQISASWKTCNISSNTRMRIDLIMQRPNGTTVARLLRNNTLNDGVELLTLPTNTTWSQMIYGNNFKIRIRKVNQTLPQDLSDDKFTIDNSLPSVTVATDSNTPPSQNILVNNTASTLDVKLLKFNITAKGSNLTLKKIPVDISSAINVPGVVDTVKLYKDNDQIGVMSGSTGLAVVGGVITNSPCTSACGYIFSNLSSLIAAGTTASFTVAVDIKALGGNYPNGFGLTSSVENSDILIPTHFSVLDQNGDELSISQRSGFAQGQTQMFATSSINVVMGTTTAVPTTDSNGMVTSVMYTLPLTINAVGKDYYISKFFQQAEVASGTNSFAFVFNNASNPTFPDVTCVAGGNLSSLDAPSVGNTYRLDDGATRHFTLNINLVTPTTPNSSYRVALKQLQAFDNAALTTGASSMNLMPPYLFQSIYAFINN